MRRKKRLEDLLNSKLEYKKQLTDNKEISELEVVIQDLMTKIWKWKDDKTYNSNIKRLEGLRVAILIDNGEHSTAQDIL